MVSDPKGTRSSAEERLRSVQRTNDVAKGIADAMLDAARKKTARLKAERLAKEAAEEKSNLDKKPARKRRALATPKPTK